MKGHVVVRRRKRGLTMPAVVAVFVLVIAVLLILKHVVVFNPVVELLTIEAGAEELSASDFLEEGDEDVEISFVTDVSAIELNHVGKYTVVLSARGKEWESALMIEDTTPPQGETCDLSVNVGGEVSVEDIVTEVTDATDVTCAFRTLPDLTAAGTVEAVVVLTDEGGNQTELTSQITVIRDDEAPVIEGVMTLTAFIGDAISYKSGITVTDNCDTDVELEVDTSQVDAETAGMYPVTYTATDSAGNTVQETTYITISEKPEENVDEETVLEMAQEVLDEITTEDMTKKQIARAIYDWARSTIGYVSTSEKDSWTNGAYQGFTTHSGDCYIYFSTCKALLTQADIPNIDVVKSDTSHSSHYWSLVDVGDGWYHFDATPRSSGGEFFLLTDEELLEYSEAHSNSHIFDQSLYPATPTTDSTIE
ncbi:MAG: transglutaminase [Clostridiales bacterium]|nr:transglutaminase [Clostridiales bacterium]